MDMSYDEKTQFIVDERARAQAFQELIRRNIQERKADNPTDAFYTAQKLKEDGDLQRKSYLESVIIQDDHTAFDYATNVLKTRWPDIEGMVIENPTRAAIYASECVGGRWPEAEPIIQDDPYAAVLYARKVIGGEWPQGEAAIMTCSRSIVEYARNVLQRTWPEAEETLKQDDPQWDFYSSHFYGTEMRYL